jgi:hypothetical protein
MFIELLFNFVLSLACNQIYLLNDGTDIPVIVDGENTGIEGLLVSCAVTNAQNIISPSTTDFALIETTAGVASTASIAVLMF